MLLRVRFRHRVTDEFMTAVVVVMVVVAYLRLLSALLPELGYSPISMRMTYAEVALQRMRRTIKKPVVEPVTVTERLEPVASRSQWGGTSSNFTSGGIPAWPGPYSTYVAKSTALQLAYNSHHDEVGPSGFRIASCSWCERAGISASSSGSGGPNGGRCTQTLVEITHGRQPGDMTAVEGHLVLIPDAPARVRRVKRWI